ncbi:MAG TPA: hypothetical protein VKZ77_14870 [Bacillaceae bacterium]|uniref:Uncharacterized protein n=2 Tax=Lederbergia graminis TaxID=735518 RepID=A0ABW0LH35_9BACI|nr:hypothetical protein [Paenibacillus bovis]HLU23743.1 hypothetical protein [Bacillaceae bacterium]
MMLKDKDHKSTASKQIDSKETLKPLQKLKTFEFDNSSGFSCDINTGICGPVEQQKEGKN